MYFLQLLNRITDSIIIIYRIDYLLIKGVVVKVVKLINKVVDCGKMWYFFLYFCCITC